MLVLDEVDTDEDETELFTAVLELLLELVKAVELDPGELPLDPPQACSIKETESNKNAFLIECIIGVPVLAVILAVLYGSGRPS